MIMKQIDLTEEEVREMFEVRRNFVELTEREKYILYEALKPYFDDYKKK
jgi:hypothetical protein